MNSKKRKRNTALIAVIGVAAVLLILIVGTIRMGQNARKDTEQAVSSVSRLYLDELAGRREEVVAENLRDRILDIQTTLDLLTEEDLADREHLEAFQRRMRHLFQLEKFAFVDADGQVYTSDGTPLDIGEYPFDYRTLQSPVISVKGLDTADKTVVIAVPVDRISFEGKELTICFTETSMQEMLSGISLQAQGEGTTFCNIYTRDGIALSNTVLGGLAVEANLLEAMSQAEFDEGNSYEEFLESFRNGENRDVSFTYGGIRETLSYVPVEGTDWMLTYLIRESVISGQIGSMTDGIIRRSIRQSLLTTVVLLLVFTYVLLQSLRNARLQLEKETSDAENRVKREELEQRLALQEELLQKEKEREQQDRMITALASDYWSVYYLELDQNEGVCYQAHADVDDGLKAGEHFPYLETVTSYAERYVTDSCREEFLRFVRPDAVREGLKKNQVISYTYTVFRHGKESYEMVRFAGVRQPGDAEDAPIHTVGACFSDVDRETRENLSRQEALRDALAQAEQANMAKTAFLSNMSHEIRTPMNAIIGLDNIALNDPETPPKTKEYLEKIGGSAEHLLNLINDILDMSRIESGRMTLKNEEFSFRKLLEAINTIFSGQCTEKGLEYHCHIRGEVDDYYIGDNMKLRQVLINILGNAVKFTPEGGRVELEVERTAKYDRQSTLRFRIADTGIGMSRDFLPRIFDTFTQEDASTTSKYGSSGLGMSITKNIVEMMNGDIQVDSEKGKGTTFTVTVTLMDSDRNDSGEESDEIHPGEMNVLIIDDDAVACAHAKLVLEKAGIAAEVASSGREGLDMVRLRHARRDPYNLILVDWKMPEMDGVETTRQIRSVVGNESAIVILTAYRWDDILEEAVSAGVDSFLAKPLFAGAVLEEFAAAVNRKGIVRKKKEKKAELAGRRILLAEDVEINAEIMMMVLGARNMETDLAVNGKIAVEMFAEHPAGTYAAILMDMRMPEMDGLEATRVIRAMDREDAAVIPIIALTANAFDEDVQRSMQAGLNAHLSKPVQPEVLYETLESLIQD